MNDQSVSCHSVLSHPFEENTFILHRPDHSECLVVDPGLEPEKIVDLLTKNNLTPVAILNTHGHSDHIAGNAEMKQRWPDAPLIIGRHDAPKLTDPVKNLSAPFGLPLVSPPADRLIDEGECLRFAGIELQVLDTPGHSCGHVVFLCRHCQPYLLVGGDVLFRGSIGRTDFPDGSFEDLQRCIHEKLFVLPSETVVLPGHGPATTIGQEQRFNPFVGMPAGWAPANRSK
ncbi:MAG: MBL fold metallo-hydrolase [Pirellulaceae bacterium]